MAKMMMFAVTVPPQAPEEAPGVASTVNTQFVTNGLSRAYETHHLTHLRVTVAGAGDVCTADVEALQPNNAGSGGDWVVVQSVPNPGVGTTWAPAEKDIPFAVRLNVHGAGGAIGVTGIIEGRNGKQEIY